MKRRLAIMFTAAIAATFALGGLAAPQAHAQYNYDSLIGDVHRGPEFPVGYRDDNFSILIQDNDTQYVFGFARFTAIQSSDTSVPAMKDTALDSAFNRSLDEDENSSTPYITGLFFAEALGMGDNPENGTGATNHQYFAPVADGTSVSIDGEDFVWNPATEGSILQLYATGLQLFDPDTLAAAFSGGAEPWDLLAALGFTEEASVDAEYANGDPYYAVQIDTDAETPLNSKGNLDVLLDLHNMFPGLVPHDGGRDVYVNVNRFATPNSSSPWQFRGEGGSIRFLIPTPAAVGPGLALLGVIALIRKPRRNQTVA